MIYFNPELFSLNHSKAMTQQGFNDCPLEGQAGLMLIHFYWTSLSNILQTKLGRITVLRMVYVIYSLLRCITLNLLPGSFPSEFGMAVTRITTRALLPA